MVTRLGLGTWYLGWERMEWYLSSAPSQGTDRCFARGYMYLYWLDELGCKKIVKNSYGK